LVDLHIDWTFKSVKEYLDGLKLSGISNMTLNNYISTIRLYSQFMKYAELIKFPLYPRSKNIIRRPLSDEQIEAFLSVPNRKCMSEERYQMFNIFWLLCAYLALRPGECARLKKTDIDLPNKQIMLRPEMTKTNQFSTLPIFPNVLPKLEQYLSRLKTDYLFPSKHGGKYCNGKEPVIDHKDWALDFYARLKQCGIEKVPGLVPYSLRHSCATRWLTNGMDLVKVRRLMRHVKIEQTMTYEHMTSGHLVQSTIKHDPLMRKYADPKDVLETAEDNLNDFGINNDPRFSEEFKKKLRDLFYDEQRRLREKNFS